MHQRLLQATIVLLTPWFCLPVQSWARPTIGLSGFGTLGYIVSDSSDFEYRTGSGATGADHSGTFSVDTRVGVQLDSALNDTFSVTTQGLFRQNYKGDFAPVVEWAFIRAQLSDSVTLRLGRIGTPFFMMSDYREVGFASTTARPPEDTYSLAPLRTIEGFDVTSEYELGDTQLNAQFFAGKRQQRFRDDIQISLEDAYGTNLTFERGVVKVRLSYVSARVGITSASSVALSDVLVGLAANYPELESLTIDFNGRRKKSVFTSIGLELDLAPWFVAAEYAQRRIENSFTASIDAWYATAGYRRNNFTPYITLSTLTQVSKTEVSLPTEPQLDALRLPLSENYLSIDQSTVAVGIRWDAYDNAAIKFQFENVSRDVEGYSFRPTAASDGNSDDVKLISVTLDYIF